MNDYLLLYLFTRLDVIHEAFLTIFTLLFVAGCGALILGCFEHIEPAKLWAKRLFIFSACFGVLTGLIPIQKDMMIIVGGKMAIDMSNSKPVADLSKKIFTVINKKLDETTK